MPTKSVVELDHPGSLKVELQGLLRLALLEREPAGVAVEYICEPEQVLRFEVGHFFFYPLIDGLPVHLEASGEFSLAVYAARCHADPDSAAESHGGRFIHWPSPA